MRSLRQPTLPRLGGRIKTKRVLEAEPRFSSKSKPCRLKVSQFGGTTFGVDSFHPRFWCRLLSAGIDFYSHQEGKL